MELDVDITIMVVVRLCEEIISQTLHGTAIYAYIDPQNRQVNNTPRIEPIKYPDWIVRVLCIHSLLFAKRAGVLLYSTGPIFCLQPSLSSPHS